MSSCPSSSPRALALPGSGTVRCPLPAASSGVCFQVSLPGPLRDHSAAGAGPPRNRDHLLNTSERPGRRGVSAAGVKGLGERVGERRRRVSLELSPLLFPVAINGWRREPGGSGRAPPPSPTAPPAASRVVYPPPPGW